MSVTSWLRDLDADALAGRLRDRAAVVVPSLLLLATLLGASLGYLTGLLTAGPLFDVADFGAAVWPIQAALLGSIIGLLLGAVLARRWYLRRR